MRCTLAHGLTWIIHEPLSFLGVILSDERSEESKDPFGPPRISLVAAPAAIL
jgi:hypothetical protein